MMRSRLFLTLLIVFVECFVPCVSGWSVSVQTNFILTTATTPICSDAQRVEWEETKNHSNGIAGEDPVGHWIGPYPAWGGSSFWGGPAIYSPNDVIKRTLCGKLVEFSVFDISGDEWDWGLVIIPSSNYADLLVSLNGLGDRFTENKDCEGGEDNCMEAEITPDDHFEHNPWFDYDENNLAVFKPGKTPLIGNYLCTYGPWVADNGHGKKAEIHPSELLWWRSGSSAYLLLQQDDSNRFDRADDFDGDFDSGWHPWSQYPRTGKFKLAFSLNPDLEPARFDIFQENVRNVWGDTGDADDGSEHALEYDGKVLLSVREMLYPDGNVQVNFESVCRAPGNRLWGYVTLTSKVGFDDDGGEGFHLLRVEQFSQPSDDDVGRPPILEPLPTTWKVIIRGKLLSRTVRRVVSNKRAQLLGDVQIRTVINPNAKLDDWEIEKVDMISGKQRQSLSFQSVGKERNQSDGQVVVKNVLLHVVNVETKGSADKVKVPGYRGTALEIKLKSGDVQGLVLPVISLSPFIKAEEPKLSSLAEKDRQTMYKAAGVSPLTLKQLVELQVSPAQLLKVGQWQLDAAPRYASLKEGRVSPDDDSPFAQALNDTLRSADDARISALFGSEQPFKINWSFSAVNLTSGASVRVRVGKKISKTQASVEFLPNKIPNGSIKFTFPDQPSGDVYELTATAAITDNFGATGKIQHRIYSHVLSDNTPSELVEKILPMLAAHAGLSAREFMMYSTFDKLAIQNRGLRNSKSARARSLRLFTMRAAADKRITVAELRGLIQIANLFKKD